MKYFLDNPNKNISHNEIVPIIAKQWEEMTGKPFADPDRARCRENVERVKKSLFLILNSRIPPNT